MDTHGYAWAAGFFDGEGSTMFYTNSENGHAVLRCSISQKDIRVLEKFKSIFDKGTMVFLKTAEMHRFATHTFADTQFVIACIWKWLGIKKREQYKLAVQKYYEHRKKYKHNEEKYIRSPERRLIVGFLAMGYSEEEAIKLIQNIVKKEG